MKLCQKRERLIVCMGLMISAGSFLATMLLTNLDLLTVVRYLVVGVAVSFIPLAHLLDGQYSKDVSEYARYFLLIMLLAVTIFQRGFMFKGDSGKGYNLLDVGGIIKSGPEFGIVTDYFTAYSKNQSMKDWETYIKPGDSLLLVNTSVESAAYLYEDIVISNPSTISTPTYSEELLTYWEEYPHRFPNVIAVSCWFGQLHVSEESWIMQWMQSNYTPCQTQDGMYWRFYRLIEE